MIQVPGASPRLGGMPGPRLEPSSKTTAELLDELAQLKRRVRELEHEESVRRDTEDALRESERRFRQLTEYFEGTFWLTEWETRKVLYVSPAYEELWERTRESLYADARSWSENIHPSDRERVVAAFERDAERGCYDIEYRILLRDGGVRWIHDRAFPIRDETGRVYRLAGTSEDITRRKEAAQEERARQIAAQRRQAAIVQLATSEAIASGDFDEAARVITEAVAQVLDVERVGVWLLRDEGRILGCVDQYCVAGRTHVSGTLLRSDDYPAYFAALKSGRAVDASVARSDPRTAELAAYLASTDVSSLLDAAIRVSGRVVGVVCHERKGEPRSWSPEEVTFAGEVADQAAQALQNRDRRASETALRESEARLVEAQRVAHIGSWSLDIPTDRVWWSRELYRLFDTEPEHFTPSVPAFLERVMPEDREQIQRRLDRSLTTGESFEAEFRIALPCGTTRYIHSRGELEADESGRPRVLSGTAQDITERKRGEKRLRLMIEELDHRVKNTLATVMAISEHTLRTASSLADFADAFEGRIASLAKVHEALARDRWEGVQLTELLRTTFAPHEQGGESRFERSGPAVLLPVEAVLPLAMTLHELVTNAVKYGPLSADAGRVALSWTVRAADEKRMLELSWIERGGPRVEPPASRGFGSALIENGVRYELGGSARLSFEPGGVRCDLRIPLYPGDG